MLKVYRRPEPIVVSTATKIIQGTAYPVAEMPCPDIITHKAGKC